MFGLELLGGDQPLSLGIVSAVAVFAGVLVRTTLKNISEDRGAGFDLAARNREVIDHHEARIKELEAEVAENRSLKHHEINERMKAEWTIESIRRLAQKRTPEAMDLISELLDRREPREGDSL